MRGGTPHCRCGKEQYQLRHTYAICGFVSRPEVEPQGTVSSTGSDGSHSPTEHTQSWRAVSRRSPSSTGRPVCNRQARRSRAGNPASAFRDPDQIACPPPSGGLRRPRARPPHNDGGWCCKAKNTHHIHHHSLPARARPAASALVRTGTNSKSTRSRH